jgi:hypothetical protein
MLLLGSSHSRKILFMLRETLDKKSDIVSTVKPNAPLTIAVEYLGKLGKNFTRKDHVIGPGNSLDRNYNHSIEKASSSLQRGQPT